MPRGEYYKVVRVTLTGICVSQSEENATLRARNPNAKPILH